MQYDTTAMPWIRVGLSGSDWIRAINDRLQWDDDYDETKATIADVYLGPRFYKGLEAAVGVLKERASLLVVPWGVAAYILNEHGPPRFEQTVDDEYLFERGYLGQCMGLHTVASVYAHTPHFGFISSVLNPKKVEYDGPNTVLLRFCDTDIN